MSVEASTSDLSLSETQHDALMKLMHLDDSLTGEEKLKFLEALKAEGGLNVYHGARLETDHETIVFKEQGELRDKLIEGELIFPKTLATCSISEQDMPKIFEGKEPGVDFPFDHVDAPRKGTRSTRSKKSSPYPPCRQTSGR